MDYRLIIVDGIMGAGKSSTADFLSEQLRRNGYDAQFIGEGSPDLRVRALGKGEDAGRMVKSQV